MKKFFITFASLTSFFLFPLAYACGPEESAHISNSVFTSSFADTFVSTLLSLVIILGIVLIIQHLKGGKK